jgi:hypothetical protein
MSNNNSLTVDGTLNIGNSTNSRTLTTNNNAVINVAGTLIIWGNVIVNNNIVWNISGTVIIKGNLILSNNATVNVSGNLGVNGNLNAGNNTNFAVSGTVTVGGSTNVGNGSNLTGCSGCYHSGGTCTGPASFCGSGTLPVKLLSLKATEANAQITLSWTTATEENADMFVVQHSIDGATFDDVTSVQAHGNSVVKIDYQWVDEHPSIGNNYYRLRMVDLDQTFEYSPVVNSRHDGEKEIFVYPNPSQGQSIHVVTNYEASGDATVQVYDNLGVKIMEATLIDGQLDFNGALRVGNYILKYVNGSDAFVTRFSVRQ